MKGGSKDRGCADEGSYVVGRLPKPKSFEGSLHVFKGLGVSVVFDFNRDVELIRRDGGSLEWNATEKNNVR